MAAAGDIARELDDFKLTELKNLYPLLETDFWNKTIILLR